MHATTRCSRSPSWRSATRGAPLAPEGGASDAVKPYSQQDRLCIETIRTLAIDAVQAASSGHPGAPLSLAPAAYVLFARVMRHNPADPAWPDRDRFVLSAGHA